MKRQVSTLLASLVLVFGLIAGFYPGVEAQRGSGIVKQQTIDIDEEAMTVSNLSDIPTFGVSVVNAGTYTLNFEGSLDGGSTYVAHYCAVNDDSGDTAASTTAAGTWFCTNAGLTNFRVRASAYTSGAPVVTVTRGFAKGGGTSAIGGGGGGGAEIDPPSIGNKLLHSNGTIIVGYNGDTCAAGSSVTEIDDDGQVTCASLVGTSTTGHIVTNTSGALTDYAGSSCSVGDAVTGISVAGVVTCGALEGATTTGHLALNTSGAFVDYAGATCGVGLLVSEIEADGSVTCASPPVGISGPANLFYITGRFYPLSADNSFTFATANMANNRGDIFAYRPLKTWTPDQLGAQVATGNASTAIKVLVYASDVAGGWPGTLLWKSESLATTSSNTYVFSTTGGTPTQIPTFTGGTLYWVGVISSGAVPNLRIQNTSTTMSNGLGQDTGIQNGADFSLQQGSLTYATPPDPWGFAIGQAVIGPGVVIVGRAP